MLQVHRFPKTTYLLSQLDRFENVNTPRATRKRPRKRFWTEECATCHAPAAELPSLYFLRHVYALGLTFSARVYSSVRHAADRAGSRTHRSLLSFSFLAECLVSGSVSNIVFMSETIVPILDLMSV